jgi:hypothetical protein
VGLHSSTASSANTAIGVPMEVMGLMLGEFVDDYTVRVVDVSRTLFSNYAWC